jgi:hypothetical protein
MPNRPLHSRAAEYRARAAETRARAQAVADESARDSLLQDAQAWDRMADWEDKTNQPNSGQNSN